MNSFNNDGGFLERFKAMQQKAIEEIPFPKGIKPEPIEPEVPSREIKKAKVETQFGNAGRFLMRFKKQKTSTDDVKEVPCSSVLNSVKPSPSAFLYAIKRRVQSKNQASRTNVETSNSAGSLANVTIKEETGDAQFDPKTEAAIGSLSREVREKGSVAEDDVKMKYQMDPAYGFLHDPESPAYKMFHRLAYTPIKSEPPSCVEEGSSSSSSTSSTSAKKRKRNSRWDVDDSGNIQAAPSIVSVKLEPSISCPDDTSNWFDDFGNLGQSEVSIIVEEARKQILEQEQLKLMQQRIEVKRAAMKIREQAVLMGKAKPIFEYDSDEDAEDGTWEHKLRQMEMEKTKDEAEKLTEDGQGKHHIGQFLPSEEFEKFVARCQAAKEGKAMDQSDYRDSKLTEDNKGFKLLQKMGWTEGKGLGACEQGITAPVNKGRVGAENEGLGASTSNNVSSDDNEYDMYRKRMMLSYRFRPNPLNNPRRSYY